MGKRITAAIAALVLLALVGRASAADTCQAVTATGTDQAVSFAITGCPVVFNTSAGTIYAQYDGTAASTSTSTAIAAGTSFGPCMVQTSVVHLKTGGSSLAARVCMYSGVQ